MGYQQYQDATAEEEGEFDEEEGEYDQRKAQGCMHHHFETDLSSSFLLAGCCGKIWVMADDVSFPLHIAAFLGFTVSGCMPEPLPRRTEVRVGVFLRAELSRMVVCRPGCVPSQGVQEDLNQKPEVVRG